MPPQVPEGRTGAPRSPSSLGRQRPRTAAPVHLPPFSHVREPNAVTSWRRKGHTKSRHLLPEGWEEPVCSEEASETPGRGPVTPREGGTVGTHARCCPAVAWFLQAVGGVHGRPPTSRFISLLPDLPQKSPEARSARRPFTDSSQFQHLQLLEKEPRNSTCKTNEAFVEAISKKFFF